MSTHTNRLPAEPALGHSKAEWQQQVEHYEQCLTDSVRENPLAATLVVFGVGFGVGTLIGGMLGDSISGRHENLAHSLGRRMLDSISDVMPASVSSRLHS